MMLSSFNTVFIYLYLSVVFNPSHGVEVFQPKNKTVNPDGTVSISCEHTADTNSVIDVRLSKISGTNSSLLCQKGMEDCDNVIMYKEKSRQNKYIFILLNITQKAMDFGYECEVTTSKNDIERTWTGTPTKLIESQLQGQLAEPPPPLPPQFPHLIWILIGLLTLMFAYSLIITFFYMRPTNTSKDCENSTYVEMRNVPVQRNHDHIYNIVQKS